MSVVFQYDEGSLWYSYVPSQRREIALKEKEKEKEKEKMEVEAGILNIHLSQLAGASAPASDSWRRLCMPVRPSVRPSTVHDCMTTIE